MKLLWFHLMPYTELPDDFAETNDSVWVSIDRALFDPVKAHGMYNDFIDEMVFAAEVGFDAVCVNEHHANGYGMMPSPNLIASILARSTSDAAIVLMGNSLALYNPPIRVAEEMAMLDVISGGRLIAGMPVGTPMDTAYAYSQNPATLRARYREAHELIVKAWTAEEPFDWHGRYYQLADVNVWQQPIQKPHPPIWIPGGASVETWRWAAEQDYLYSYLSYFGHKLARKTMQGFWECMDELGKDRNPYRAGFLQFVGVAGSKAEAIELYREPAEYFYNNCLHVAPWYANPPGYLDEETVRQKLQSQVAMAADKSATAGSGKFRKRTTMEEIVDKGYIVVGNPDEVAEELQGVATELNIGQLMLLLHFGNMDKDTCNHNTALFASKVAPQLRGMFDEWENRWWPQPVEQRRRADAVGVA